MRITELTVVGTRREADRRVGPHREGRGAGAVEPGRRAPGAEAGARRLFARRGRLRPATQHRHPRRQPRPQQEGDADGGRDPVRPRPLRRARRVLLSRRHPHGGHAGDQGPGRRQLRPPDRGRGGRSDHPPRAPAPERRRRSGRRAVPLRQGPRLHRRQQPPLRLPAGGRAPAHRRLQGTGRRRRHRIPAQRTDDQAALHPRPGRGRVQRDRAEAGPVERRFQRELPGPDRRGLPGQPAATIRRQQAGPHGLVADAGGAEARDRLRRRQQHRDRRLPPRLRPHLAQGERA